MFITEIHFKNRAMIDCTDSTQFDSTDFKEVFDCWIEFCKENDLRPDCIESSEVVEIPEEIEL